MFVMDPAASSREVSVEWHRAIGGRMGAGESTRASTPSMLRESTPRGMRSATSSIPLSTAGCCPPPLGPLSHTPLIFSPPSSLLNLPCSDFASPTPGCCGVFRARSICSAQVTTAPVSAVRTLRRRTGNFEASPRLLQGSSTCRTTACLLPGSVGL